MDDVLNQDPFDVSDIGPVRVRSVDARSRYREIIANTIPKRIFTPGEVVSVDQSALKGHGTYESDDKLKSSVAGTCERVLKLIIMKPIRYRYSGEVGDVVVGRILEVQQRRWRVNVKARLDAILQLTAVNLPGGEVRRKCDQDERMMRELLREGDLLSAEVRSVYSDGSLCLHTRSLRYGKLSTGFLVEVPCSLVKRCRTHFIDVCGISLILGINGMIWLYPSPPSSEQTSGAYNADQNSTVEIPDRLIITRVALCIKALAQNRMLIYTDTISLAFEASKEYAVNQLTEPEVITNIIISVQKTANETESFH